MRHQPKINCGDVVSVMGTSDVFDWIRALREQGKLPQGIVCSIGALEKIAEVDFPWGERREFRLSQLNPIDIPESFVDEADRQFSETMCITDYVECAYASGYYTDQIYANAVEMWWKSMGGKS